MPRIASLLRRRTTTIVPTTTQGQPGIVAQQGPTTAAEVLALDGIGVGEARTGWNDVPRDTRAELGRWPRTEIMAAMQRSDGNVEEALRLLQSSAPSEQGS